MEGKEIFSKFDIRWGYNNIPIEEGNRQKAAFKTPLGMYQPKVLYFGMKNAPAQWTRLMWRNFRPWRDKWFDHMDTSAGSYMDDFFIASKKTPKGKEGHRQCTHKLLGLMAKHWYHLQPAKCQWEQTQMEFLRILVKAGKMRVDPAKRDGISRWPRVFQSKVDVQWTMGVLQYQRRFIPNFAHMARPIFATIKKGQKFKWTKEAEVALDNLIKKIEADPQISYPNPDKPFEMEIDASDYGTGAVLIQRDEAGK
jgi:hypothetical protein